MNTYDGTASADGERTLVGVAEFEATDGGRLVAYGLGACVGVVLLDRGAGVAGLAHAMLPKAAEAGTQAAPAGKFVDATVEGLLRAVVQAGGVYNDVQACLVGGADLIDLEALPREAGARNVAVAREELAALNVPVVAEATGGDYGRTVEVDAATGTVRVSTAADETGEVIFP